MLVIRRPLPHGHAGCCMAVGLEYRCLEVGMLSLLRLEHALEHMLCMLSQHHAIGLQTSHGGCAGPHG